MKTSTEIHSTANLVGEEKAVELIAKAGFDAWDFSMFDMCKYNYAENKPFDIPHPLNSSNYVAFARRLKQIGLDNGIHCNQSHAPFPVRSKEVRSYLKRAIECTYEAGGNICIIHPDNDKSATENAEMYFELLEFSKPLGVKIACENMFNYDASTQKYCFAACSNPESFVEHLNAVNDDYFVACLDIGHSEMHHLGTSAVKMIEKLKDKLQALHVHDNDLTHDCHAIPLSMNIDFTAIMTALKKHNYQGYLTLEADQHLSSFNKDNAFEGVKELYNSAKRLLQIYENV